MAKAEQFTSDAPVPPSGILPSQPDHQIPQLTRDRWTPDRVRVRPAPGDQPAMPAQQGARRHDPMESKPLGQQPGKRGQQRPVGPVHSRPGDLTAQHGDLVSQDQDLHLLGCITSRKERQPAEQPDHQQIQEA
jgi:hypothetical protein